MSKKGENIRKRKDGRWEGRYKKGYKPNGSILYGSIYGKTYRETREKMRIAMAMPHGEDSSASLSSITFAQLFKLWQESNEVRLKGGTKNKYSYLISSHLNPTLGNLRLSEVTASSVNAFLSEQLLRGRLNGSAPLSPSYVRSMSLIISSALKYGVREELCQPLKGNINKPASAKREPDVLTPEEQRNLEKHIKEYLTPTGVGIMLSLYTGLRIGEVCALKWDDLDLVTGTLHVRHTVARVRGPDDGKSKLILDEPKTRSSKRVIPIPSPIIEFLGEYKGTAESEFVTSDKPSFISPRTYETRYRRITSDCGIRNLNYHALRHTFATRCVEAGVDVKSLSEILGHAGVNITLNTYVHSSLNMKKCQLEKLAQLSGTDKGSK
ncbi:MAG: site-specific integrase [Ruminococcaceae bacterium]|nr:site-specific integrase [Oscillospiraceae bacterium]